MVEIRGGRVQKIAPGRTLAVLPDRAADLTGRPAVQTGRYTSPITAASPGIAGLPVGPAPDYETGRIERIGQGGSVQRLYTSCDGLPLSAPNDLVFDTEGNFYFTDPIHRDPTMPEPLGTPTKRQGNVYYATPDGKRIRRVATNLQHPNGIGLTPDGKTLLVAETFAASLCAFPIRTTGELGERRPFSTLPVGYYPDGFCLDEEGYVLVCGVLGGGIIVFDPSGTQVDLIPCADRIVTNIAFGGPAHSTLYTTESGLGRVVARQWKRRGLVLFPDQV